MFITSTNNLNQYYVVTSDISIWEEKYLRLSQVPIGPGSITLGIGYFLFSETRIDIPFLRFPDVLCRSLL